MSETVKHIIDGFAGKESRFSKRVGLYFGSFNPIHIGHLIIANYMAQTDAIDEVWFVVSPHNPHKKKKNLLEDYHRLAMVRRAVEDNAQLRASDIEFGLPKPSYTVYTLQALKEKHPDYEFTLIMGADNLRSLHKWKNYEQIIERHSILVYPRVLTIQEKTKESAVENNELLSYPNIQMTDAPVMKISSSFIRSMIAEGKDVRYLLSEPVYRYLDRNEFLSLMEQTILALHIIFIVTWFAGLFYIVRLFVYQKEAEARPENEKHILIAQYRIMAKRLWYGITWPSFVLTLILGPTLLYLYPVYLKMTFMHIKLTFVFGLIIYHFICHRYFIQLQKTTVQRSSQYFRIWNEVATLFLVAIVFLIVMKNKVNWIYGTLGFFILSILLMIAIKLYKKMRQK